VIQSPAGTTPRTPVEQFAGVAALELSTLKALIGVLNEEREALTQGDAEALPGMIASKTHHMAELARFSGERGRVLGAAGVAARGSDIRGFLAADAEALGTWEELLNVARKAAGLNTANAFLTSTRLASVSRALATLTGAQPDFYDLRGSNSRPAGTSRPLSRG
jgi:flagellar biosynthesis/type III secretory pathway chaperone